MLEKFLLAITFTLCIKLLLGVSFSATNPSSSSYHLVEAATPWTRLNILSRSTSAFTTTTAKGERR